MKEILQICSQVSLLVFTVTLLKRFEIDYHAELKDYKVKQYAGTTFEVSGINYICTCIYVFRVSSIFLDFRHSSALEPCIVRVCS